MPPAGAADAVPPVRGAARRLGPLLLFGAALAEASVFPAPTEALLLALVLAARERLAALVAVAAAGSLLGSLAGYLGGAFLHDLWVEPLLADSEARRLLARVAALYGDGYPLALATSGFTPIPYLVYTSAAGASGIPLLPFLLFALLGRVLKYAVLGALAHLFGPAVHALLRRLGPRVGVAAALLLALLAWLAWRP